MTVETTVSRAGPYAGAGTVGPFPVPFRFLENAHLRLIKTLPDGTNSDLVLDVDYSVAGAGDDTGSVTLTAPLFAQYKLTILRNVPATQEADYVENDPFPAESHERALDKLTMIVQQQGESLGRALTVPATDPSVSLVLPGAASRARRYLSFDEFGRPVSTTFDVDEVARQSQAAIDAAAEAKDSSEDAAESALEAKVYADYVREESALVGEKVNATTPNIVHFTGDGSTVEFALPSNPGSKKNLIVSIDGVLQHQDAFDVTSGSDRLVFAEAPPATGADNIEVRIAPSVMLTVTDAQDMTFVGPDGVKRNVGEYLRDGVSTAAFQFATRAAASAAAATLPDGQEIEAPDADGRLSRFAVQSGALVFKDYAPDAIRMQSYTALRAYTGKAHAVDITTPGLSGRFNLDAGDTTTADNGWAVIVGNDGRRWRRLYDGMPNIKWWGAKGDGVTQDYAAIQAALDSGVKSIFFPVGKYLCNQTLNITNRSLTGSPLFLKGEIASYDDGGLLGGSVIVSNPGNGNWIAELAGSQFTVIEDLKFVSSGANSATYGLLYTRTTQAMYSQNNSLRRVLIRLESKGGTTIALGNNCSEHFVMDECWLEADMPFVTTLINEFGFTSQYATISNAVLSNTAMAARISTFTPLSGAAMVLVGLASANFDNCVWIPSSGNTHQSGIIFRSSLGAYADCQNIKLSGQIESFVNPLYFEGNTSNISAKLSTSVVTGTHAKAYSGTTQSNLELEPSLLNGFGLSVISGASSITLNGGRIVIPPGAVQTAPEVKFVGTEIDGGALDLSSASNFSCAEGSSVHPRWSNSRVNGKGTWNPGAVVSGSATAATFTVVGARIGDNVQVAWPYQSQGCILQASVDYADVVRLVMINLTGATANFTSGTFKVTLERPLNI